MRGLAARPPQGDPCIVTLARIERRTREEEATGKGGGGEGVRAWPRQGLPGAVRSAPKMGLRLGFRCARTTTLLNDRIECNLVNVKSAKYAMLTEWHQLGILYTWLKEISLLYLRKRKRGAGEKNCIALFCSFVSFRLLFVTRIANRMTKKRRSNEGMAAGCCQVPNSCVTGCLLAA